MKENDSTKATPETDWLSHGRINRPYIERTLQDLVGSLNRKDYPGVAQQFDVFADSLDEILAGGVDEEKLKAAVGQLTIAAAAVAYSAMPEAFNITVD